ncbi:hypothetical protein CspeluHIS016_0406660 [Cutaneotrichosporon spelunceum]|uniref:F-box domain-containing protein n=1 Tax=Cutaneotrichosporon spelunceum TaxID=1672016 RepID=A0AAD3YDD1_9TREE|nr:hypothetical protein CspeluHIS016_0406660 [Cutaneotrichosporon spelunceum]
MSCTVTTTAAASPTRRGIPPKPLPADVLKTLLLKLCVTVKPAFKLSQKMLNRVLDFVPSSNLAPLLTVNSDFYRATKPQFFRELNLTKDFKVHGWGYDLADTWTEDYSRPLFKVEWLSRVTTVLTIEGHDQGTCNVLQHLDLPLLRTVRLPYDVHHSIANRAEPTQCGIHAFTPANVVHTDLSWHPALGTTSNFGDGTVQTYTVFLARSGLQCERRFADPMAPAYCSGVTVTYVFPVVPFAPSEGQPSVGDRKINFVNKNVDRADHNSSSVNDKPTTECPPLKQIPKGMPFNMDTYRQLTNGCEHNAKCIHVHFLNCVSSMNTAFWCNIVHTNAKFVFVGLDELVSSILAERRHVNRAGSHLAFLAKAQAGEFLELVNLLEEVNPGVDPKELMRYHTAFKKYHSIDGPVPFDVMCHKDWQFDSGAEIAMLRKDLEMWRRALKPPL